MEDKTLRFNGRLYKKENGRWYVDSRKRWRPVYDTGRLEALKQREQEEQNASGDFTVPAFVATQP